MKPVNYNKLNWQERREIREDYIKEQNGKCHHCRTSLDKDPASSVLNKPVNLRLFPANFLKYPVHLHHDHKTGMTIGAVHSRCNAVLWQYHGE